MKYSNVYFNFTNSIIREIDHSILEKMNDRNIKRCITFCHFEVVLVSGIWDDLCT